MWKLSMAGLLMILLAACNLNPTPLPTATATPFVTPTPTPGVTEPTISPTSTSPAPAATETATPSVAPLSGTGSVSGRVCFPSQFVPPMVAYFEDTEGQVTTALIHENQTAYQLDLPSGEYIAYTWTLDGQLGGLYSEYVLCGLQASCPDDHTPVSFQIEPEEMTSGIDLCDWYLTPDQVPQPPSSRLSGQLEGWENYRSQPGLYVLQYPADLQLYENQRPSVDGVLVEAPDTIAIHNTDQNYILSLTFFPIDPATTLPDFVDSQSQCVEVSGAGGQPTMLNGLDARLFDQVACGPYNTSFLYTIQGNRGYRFTIESGSNVNNVLGLVQPILDTFEPLAASP